jgi:hypothetical protein
MSVDSKGQIGMRMGSWSSIEAPWQQTTGNALAPEFNYRSCKSSSLLFPWIRNSR